MLKALFFIGLLTVDVLAHSADLSYSHDVKEWLPVAVPKQDNPAAFSAWLHAANRSTHEWRVFLREGQINADLAQEGRQAGGEQPDFVPQAEGFRGAKAIARVADGWLVGFNRGEWGGALYWFSRDGSSSYRISGHQVVRFFTFAGECHAIEGLDHMVISKGSVIRIARPGTKDRWQAHTFSKLPYAPYAVSVLTDRRMLITLSNALVELDHQGVQSTLLSDAPWGALHPNSSLVSPDGRLLYIGMRQFVGVFNMAGHSLEMLIPSGKFLNKLSDLDEERIRKQHRN